MAMDSLAEADGTGIVQRSASAAGAVAVSVDTHDDIHVAGPHAGPEAGAALVPGDLLVMDDTGILDQDTARVLLTVADERCARMGRARRDRAGSSWGPDRDRAG